MHHRPGDFPKNVLLMRTIRPILYKSSLVSTVVGTLRPKSLTFRNHWGLNGEDYVRPRSSVGEKATAPAGVDGDASYASVGTVAELGLGEDVVTVIFLPLARDWPSPEFRPARLAALYTHG